MYRLQQTITKRKTLGKGKVKKNSETTSSHNKNSEQDISHETEPTNASNSPENIENNDTEREENVTLQNQEIPPEKNFTQSSTKNDTRANNSKRSGNKKSLVIPDDSMAKLLNGWEMAKRIQSNCKICVKTFSGPTVSCMEDYMKPSLRNPQIISFCILGRICVDLF